MTSAQGFVDLLQIIVKIDEKLETTPRYNIAPTQDVLAVRQPESLNHAELVMLRWGLIPHWSKDMTIGNRMINARSETAATKAAFRQPFQRRRCLIAADGWYEWRKVGNRKQPYFIHRKDGAPLFFAGLWAHWHGIDSQGVAVTVESCAILTADAPENLQMIHPRMPLVLDKGLYEQWLNVSITDSVQLNAILKQRPLDIFTAYPVSTYVNKPSNDSLECVEPMEESVP